MSRAVFKVLSGDVNFVDYGGTWYRRVGKRRYHVMELLNWEEACGERYHGDLYNVSLSEVDLMSLPPSALKSALDCVGCEEDEPSDLMLVDACFSYGAKAPLGEFNSNNYRALMTEARALSAELDDPVSHAEAMARPVNAMGASALSFMQGDVWGRAPGAVRMAVKMKKVPSDDPLAYTTGFMSGVAGGALPDDRSDLAAAYVEGYRAGVEVRVNRGPAPEWAAS